MPKVTVYITAHNYGRFLPQAVESVLKQTLRDWELIIIDDGSTDDTAEVLKTYSDHFRIRIIHQEKPQGLPISCNNALKSANGDYIIRLDADDFFDENALLVLSSVLDSHPEVGLVYPDYYHMSEDGEILELVRRKKVDEDARLLDLPAHGAGTMIRVAALKELNGYNETIRCQDGYDLWIRFIHKFKVYNVNLPLFYYRRHGNNLTNNTGKILSTRRKIKRDFVRERFKYDMPGVLALIPARGNCLPMRELSGRPMISYTIEEVKKAEAVERMAVVTEDDAIARYCASCGVEVILRPQRLAAPNTPVEPSILFALDTLVQREGYSPDIVVMPHINSPLKKAAHIDEAVDTLLIFKTDSVISVCEDRMFHYQHRYNGLEPLFKQRQLRLEKESLYAENGALYVSLRDTVSSVNFLGESVGHIEMEEEFSVHVDRDFDFWLAEKLLERERVATECPTGVCA
ncbi:MAG: glycosyltransferase [Thermodesulfovibrionales bacterium]